MRKIRFNPDTSAIPFGTRGSAPVKWTVRPSTACWGTMENRVVEIGSRQFRSSLLSLAASGALAIGAGDIPVGDYSSTNLANIGIGHGAVDGGGGYTYFNPQTGHEISAVTGFTYNLVNPSTNYQNGIDWHLDWGASHS